MFSYNEGCTTNNVTVSLVSQKNKMQIMKMDISLFTFFYIHFPSVRFKAL